MKLIKVGNTILDLDRVMLVHLGKTPESPVRVKFEAGVPEEFTGIDADALRRYLNDVAHIDLTDIPDDAETAEVAVAATTVAESGE
jgi:hypothetical protein